MNKKICIILANYYPKISNDLFLGASKVLNEKGIRNFKKIIVPGIFEIPFVVSKYIENYDAFIALGCVIKGKTPHFDLISKATTNAIMQLSISHNKPVSNGIISCFNKKQAFDRSNPKKKNKGGEAAKATLTLLSIINDE